MIISSARWRRKNSKWQRKHRRKHSEFTCRHFCSSVL